MTAKIANVERHGPNPVRNNIFNGETGRVGLSGHTWDGEAINSCS